VVTDKDLKAGETVYLSQYVLGGFCLLVKRNGLMHVIHRNDGFIHRFDGRGEVALYCRDEGLALEEEWERCVVWEKYLLPSGAPEESSSPKHEELLPLLDPVWERSIHKALVEAIKKQGSRDIEQLVSLTVERERLVGELEVELRRRKERGNKSCLCRTCLHDLESLLRQVQKEIDKIWSWWGTSLGTTPADVTAGRWP